MEGRRASLTASRLKYSTTYEPTPGADMTTNAVVRPPPFEPAAYQLGHIPLGEGSRIGRRHLVGRKWRLPFLKPCTVYPLALDAPADAAADIEKIAIYAIGAVVQGHPLAGSEAAPGTAKAIPHNASSTARVALRAIRAGGEDGLASSSRSSVVCRSFGSCASWLAVEARMPDWIPDARWRSASFVSASPIASASASTSSTATMRPFSPSLIHSRNDGRSETTGTEPHAIASSKSHRGGVRERHRDRYRRRLVELRHPLVGNGIVDSNARIDSQLRDQALDRIVVVGVAPWRFINSTTSGCDARSLANARTTVSLVGQRVKLRALKITLLPPRSSSSTKARLAAPGEKLRVSTPHCTTETHPAGKANSTRNRSARSSESQVTESARRSALPRPSILRQKTCRDDRCPSPRQSRRKALSISAARSRNVPNERGPLADAGGPAPPQAQTREPLATPVAVQQMLPHPTPDTNRAGGDNTSTLCPERCEPARPALHMDIDRPTR